MDNKILAISIVGLLSSDQQKSGEATDLVEQLLDNGIMDGVRAKQAAVKGAYIGQLKDNGNRANRAALQVAADFDVSVSYVKNSVYYHDEIKIY